MFNTIQYKYLDISYKILIKNLWSQINCLVIFKISVFKRYYINCSQRNYLKNLTLNISKMMLLKYFLVLSCIFKLD